ncbi:amidase [Actinobaculum suis]|uniref:Amidase n=1 Tax=Actinobaculum suis TaxID=1657 RepID=A0A7Z8Y7H1_9ACTO|nr:amidase [Actinobaculum suis]VDG75602.1 amidase [Actinobaculum suis]
MTSRAFDLGGIDPLDLPAVELAQEMKNGRVDPVEHTERVLDRAHGPGATIGAFASYAEDLSLRQAEAARQAIAAGDQRPLLGVPFPIKDATAVEGLPFELGTPLLAGNIASHTDGVAQDILDAGTVTIGKTNVPEFLFPGYTEPEGKTPARSPWDLRRTAGGSSGGSATAVAAGIVPIAHGNDGGGSCRIPAASCGILGLKTTRGLVSPGPHGNAGPGLGVHGVLTRTVMDMAAGLDTIAHIRPGDDYPYPHEYSYLQIIRAEPRPTSTTFEGLRVGVLTEPLNVDTNVHSGCLNAVDRAVSLLESMGAQITRISRPFGPEDWAAFMPIWQSMAVTLPIPPGGVEKLKPLTRWLYETGQQVSLKEFLAAQAGMQAIARRMGLAFADFDVILTPGLAKPVVEPGWMEILDDPAKDFERQCEYTPWTSSWNMFGPAALAVPLHRETIQRGQFRAESDSDGVLPAGASARPDDNEPIELPFGVHFGAVMPGQEALLLRIARALEILDPWPAIKRPVAA